MSLRGRSAGRRFFLDVQAAVLKFIAPERGNDRHGSGAWQAPRGKRRHRGIDFAAVPGSQCLALEAGSVTKLGIVYADDHRFRYVEVTDDLGFRARYFYVEPAVATGDRVFPDDPLGTVQSLDGRFPGITEHVHFEVIHPEGDHIDPRTYLDAPSCSRT